jgi:hypothetical protein
VYSQYLFPSHFCFQFELYSFPIDTSLLSLLLIVLLSEKRRE